MTNEKRAHAIEWIARELGFLRRAPALNSCEMKKEWAEQIEVFEAALEALKDHVREDTKMMDHFPDAAKMVPLALEQLRGMDGQPVWVHVIDHTIFSDKEDDFDGWGMCRKSWVRIWDSKRADLVHVDYDFEDYGKEWLAYAYPPAHIDQEACMMCKSPSALNRFLEMSCRYCPKCGRPLTPEALEMLEQRLRGSM